MDVTPPDFRYRTKFTTVTVRTLFEISNHTYEKSGNLLFYIFRWVQGVVRLIKIKQLSKIPSVLWSLSQAFLEFSCEFANFCSRPKEEFTNGVTSYAPKSLIKRIGYARQHDEYYRDISSSIDRYSGFDYKYVQVHDIRRNSDSKGNWLKYVRLALDQSLWYTQIQ